MKRNAIIRICIYSLLLVVLVGLLLGGINRFRYVSGGPSSHAEYSPQPLDEASLTFRPDQVKGLDIDWAAGDIFIQKGDVDQIHVGEQAPEGERPMEAYLKGSTLQIEFGQKRFFWSGDFSKQLTVTLPRDFDLGYLDLDVASSNITIVDMTIGEVDFDGADGDFLLENCTIGELDMDTASGTVEFTGSLNTLDVDGASTDFRGVFSNCPQQLTMDGMSGSLDVTLPQGSGFTVALDGMSTQFETELPVTSRDGLFVCGDGQCKIDVDGMSVNVTVSYSG